MKLYRTTEGRWEGTQDDIRRAARETGATWDPVEVPVDKAGLLAFLNTRCAQPQAPAPVTFPGHAMNPTAIIACEPHEENDEDDGMMLEGVVLSPSKAIRVLSTLDAPDSVNVDEVVGIVSRANGYDLGRYATAVAGAFSRKAAKS